MISKADFFKTYKMSSTQKSCTCTLSLTDIMENAFLIGSSSCSISPESGCFLEMNNISKPDTGNNTSYLMTDSFLDLKVTQSSLNSLKGDLQASCDSITSFCKTPSQTCAFDFSGNSTNGKANSRTDAFCDTKSSTPCKEEKLSKLAENMLKSSEMNDPMVFKKPLPPLVWEISGIQATRDNILSLESSLEELGFLSSVKPNTSSLEVLHLAGPQAGSGVCAKKYQPTFVLSPKILLSRSES